MRAFQPLLAASVTVEQLKDLRYPLLVSPKYDGVRAVVRNGVVLSRRLKPIPNQAVQRRFGHKKLEGFDGELIIGEPTAPDCYNRTESVVMSRQHDEEQLVKFYLFDCFRAPLDPYSLRCKTLPGKVGGIERVEQLPAFGWQDVMRLEETCVGLGFEGVMLRSASGGYKFGRSTLREGLLLKLKRVADSEAVVLEVHEQRRNTNAAEKDERGYTKRSSAKAGMVGTGAVGGFRVRDLKTKVEFDCAPGVLTQAERGALWMMRHELIGRVLKYRYQPAGVKDKPRFPRFVGWRKALDR